MAETIPFKDLEQGERSKTLGRGTYGTVALLKTPLHGPIAVKYCRKTDSGQAIDHYLLRELGLLLRLREHPHVVQLRGVSDNEGRIALIFEPLTYDLEKFIRKNTIKDRIKQLPNLIRSMLDVLSTLESMNIHHFDIKPKNILCSIPSNSSDGIVFKLADFGCADNKFPQMEYFGIYITRMYRPPEMLTERLDYDRLKSDVWSLGITLLEFIVGHPVVPEHLADYEVLDVILKWCNIKYDVEAYIEESRNGGPIKECRFKVGEFLRERLYTLDYYDVEIFQYLLTKMLTLNPDYRPLAIELQSPNDRISFIPPNLDNKDRYVSVEDYSTIVKLTSNRRTTLFALEMMGRYPLSHSHERIPHLVFIISRLAEKYCQERTSFWAMFDKYVEIIDPGERRRLENTEYREKALLDQEFTVLSQLKFILYHPDLPMSLIEQVEKIKWTPEFVSVFNQDSTTWITSLLPSPKEATQD